jgi:hypothetical protein
MSVNFDWNQFEVVEPKSSTKSEIDVENQSQQPFDWNQFKEQDHEPKKEETISQKIPRHAARTVSRVAETIGGIPGDIGSIVQSGVIFGLEKAIGHKLSEEGREKLKEYRQPTSSELKGISEELTGGYTSAKTPTEKTSDEIAETVTSLIGPMKFRKALGVGLGAIAAKKGLEILGVGEGGQEAGKLGTMFMLSTLNPKGAMKYASSQYDKANKLAKGASIQVRNFENNLVNLKTDLEKGVETTAKNLVLKPTEKLLSKIKNGKLPVDELTAAKRDISTLMGDPELLRREKILLKKLGGEIDKAIKPYEKLNPEFSKAYRPANEIYGAVMQGSKASNFINKVLGTKSIIGTVLAEAALGHPEYILPSLGVAMGTKASAKGVDFITRIMKSPELQKYYIKAMSAAAAQDASALRKYEDKIAEKIR